jgi:hypothetical protein
MEYGSFKALLGLLFFGSVFLFGFMQLSSLRRERERSDSATGRERKVGEERSREQEEPSSAAR